MNKPHIAIFFAACALPWLAAAEDRIEKVASPTATVEAKLVQPQLLTTQQVENIALAADPPPGATQEERQTLNLIAKLYQQGKNDEASSTWIRIVQSHAGKDDHKEWIELESWSFYVLHRAFIQPDPDLRARAAQVRSALLRHEATHVVQQATQPERMEASATIATAGLQDALQRREHTYTALSNIMKAMHDTAVNAVRNMRS